MILTFFHKITQNTHLLFCPLDWNNLINKILQNKNLVFSDFYIVCQKNYYNNKFDVSEVRESQII